MSAKKKRNKPEESDKRRSGLQRFYPYFLLLLGGLIFFYPRISDYYYRMTATNEIRDYDRAVSAYETQEIDRRLRLAHAYNKTLDPSRLSDPFSEEEKEGRAEYARMLEVHEIIGYVEIPKIKVKLPIYAGTSSKVLEKGAGHLEGSSLPVGGTSTHSVITAHRGLPSARLFTDLDRMQEDDIFYLHVLGEVLAYRVDRILTVEPTDFDPVLVVEGKDYATLLTCTPYGINSHRLLVRGHRVAYTAPIKEEELAMRGIDHRYKYYLAISALVILLLLYLIYRNLKASRG